MDATLVVWRRPGADVSKAVADVDYVSGDRVICLEWYGKGPPPAPRWRNDLRYSLSKEERDSIDVGLQRILDTKPDQEQSAGAERRGRDLDEFGYSDEDLLHALFGVPLEHLRGSSRIAQAFAWPHDSDGGDAIHGQSARGERQGRSRLLNNGGVNPKVTTRLLAQRVSRFN